MANEKRLIDLEKLMAQFRKTTIDDVFSNWGELSPIVKSAVLRLATKYRAIILSAPPVDAVEVVRCKDCVHMRKKFNSRYCKVWHALNGMGDDGFCNYGERKDGDQS